MRTAPRATSQRAGRLTERETKILALLTAGKSNEDIADYLVLSVHTVHTHVRDLSANIEAHSTIQAVASGGVPAPAQYRGDRSDRG